LAEFPNEKFSRALYTQLKELNKEADVLLKNVG
jgi:hypothetical protein